NPRNDEDWQRLLAMLPARLDALARESKAIVRHRRISSASMLLRLVLIYVTCCFSLRDAASWAARALGVMLTDDALGYRFAHATPFVQGIAEKMLADKLHEKPAAGVSLRILDATMLSEPGSEGTDWRVHVTPLREELDRRHPLRDRRHRPRARQEDPPAHRLHVLGDGARR